MNKKGVFLLFLLLLFPVNTLAKDTVIAIEESVTEETADTKETVTEEEEKKGILNFVVYSAYTLNTSDFFRITVAKEGERQTISCDAATNQNNTIDYLMDEGEYLVESIAYQGLNMDISTHVYGTGKSFVISEEEIAILPLYIGVSSITEDDAVLANATTENTTESSIEITTQEITEEASEPDKKDVVEEITTQEEKEKMTYRSFPSYKFIFILTATTMVAVCSYIFYKKMG